MIDLEIKKISQKQQKIFQNKFTPFYSINIKQFCQQIIIILFYQKIINPLKSYIQQQIITKKNKMNHHTFISNLIHSSTKNISYTLTIYHQQINLYPKILPIYLFSQNTIYFINFNIIILSFQQMDTNTPHVQQQTITDNSFAVLFENTINPKLVQLIAGNKIQTSDGGAFRHLNFINQPWAQKIEAHNKVQKKMVAIKPKSTLITETLPRKTQILYSMDNSAIVFKLELRQGSVVIEAGTGSGSLSCAIAETIGEKGHLYTFQFNQQRAQITKKFFQELKIPQITSAWRDVVSEGFAHNGLEVHADALFLDVPNPWAAIHHAKRALKKHGNICCFSPCIEQVQRTCEQLRKQKFIKLQTIECLSRQIQILQQTNIQSPQPYKRAHLSKAVHTDRGHTGFLTFAVSL